jgi:hypothetical protein
VEIFQNPDIPFKLSHLGNTLYTPAMIEITPPPASQIVRMVPVQQNAGKVQNAINKPSSASHGNKERQAFATTGGNGVDGRNEKGMKPFEKMLGFEHAFMANMRSREGRSETRPYSSKGSCGHALAADSGSSRPATGFQPHLSLYLSVLACVHVCASGEYVRAYLVFAHKSKCIICDA